MQLSTTLPSSYLTQNSEHYDLVSKAIVFIQKHQATQPTLANIATALELSEGHLQRVFKEWAGISPKQFLQFISKEATCKKLQQNNIEDTSLERGYNSSRLYDLRVHWHSITPDEYKKSGLQLDIFYNTYNSPFGYCFIATTSKGICKLAFYDTEDELQNLINELQTKWYKANIQLSKIETIATFECIFSDRSISTSSEIQLPQTLQFYLQASPFQSLVWQALMDIPEGRLKSYLDIANSIQKPTATRAVASAIANNDIAFLIPCHRVIRNNGELSQYRWRKERKAAFIGLEAAHQFKN